jgi:hypothetical protein
MVASGQLQRRADEATSNANSRGESMVRHGIVRELWAYMKVRRKWWLLPIIVVLLLVGALLVFAQSSVLAPFIYTIF